MNLEILLTIVMSCSIPHVVFAQQAITGRRRDQRSTEPWLGVSIVKGTATDINTDADGNLSLTVSSA